MNKHKTSKSRAPVLRVLVPTLGGPRPYQVVTIPLWWPLRAPAYHPAFAVEWAQPLAFTCSRCKAQPGEPCLWRSNPIMATRDREHPTHENRYQQLWRWTYGPTRPTPTGPIPAHLLAPVFPDPTTGA